MDPKSIEGTPERAADRGREADLGFVVTDKPSLGDPVVVRGLVSEFAGEVVAARKQYNEGKITGAQAKARVLELSKEYGDIIMGRNAKYEALPWNNPSALGLSILKVIPPIPGIDDPGEELFASIGTSLVEISAAHEQGRLLDADAERHTKAMLDDTADLIVGTR